MKICFVTEYFPSGDTCDVRGGAELVAFFEAKYLSKNHTVEVITSFERGTKKKDLIGNIHVYRCGKVREYVQKNAFIDRFLFICSAYLYAKKQRYDMVTGFNFITYPVAWQISRKLRIPCLIRYHDVLIGKWILTFGITGLIGELVERYVLSRKFAAIIAVSDYTADNLKRVFHDRNRIHVIPVGVEIPGTLPPKAAVPTVACVSRLVTYKHVDDLLNALAILVKEFPDIRCNITGTGPEEDNLKRLAIRIGIQEQVTFTGFTSDRKDLLNMIASSHVFCLPGTLEGFGIVILESMACAVPFIAADIPAIREMSDKKGGLFFTGRDVADLAGKISTLLKNPALQKRLGSEGRQRANEFQWTDIIQQTEAIYKKIADEWNFPEKQ